MARRKRNARRLIVGIIIFLIAGFATFLGFSMATMDTKIELNMTYSLPEGVDANEKIKETVNLLSGETQIAVAMDGKILFKDDNNDPRAIASTAKVIMALAVMREHPLELGDKGPEIEITAEYVDLYNDYVASNGSVTRVELGEKISLYDALASALIASSNNVADTLALWTFSSMDNYRQAASRMLEEFGLEKTVIGSDASGYDSNTKSTASEMAILAQKLLENPVLREIVGTKSYTVPVAGTLENTNQLLGKQGIVGVKTGYNFEALYCLLTGYFEGEHIITVAELSAETRNNSFMDSLAVITTAQENIVPQKIVQQGEEIGYYDAWWLERTPVTAKEGLEALVLKESAKSAEINQADNSDDNFDNNLVSAKLSIKIDDIYYEVPLEVASFPKKPSLWERFLHVFGWEKARA